MMIFGPLVAPRISTVTDALSSAFASDVTVSPSTTRTTGSFTESPAAVVTLSISMTSPTATFCCLAPARTIAYTAVSFVVLAELDGTSMSGRTVWGTTLERRRTKTGAKNAHRGSIVRTSARYGKTASALARPLLLDRDVLDVRVVVLHGLPLGAVD